MATEVFSALVSLATLVKHIADDASANVTIAVALRDRVDLVIRVLQKYPDPNELDEILMSKLFKLLMQAHDLVVSYKSLSRITRVVRATAIRQQFEALDITIGKCLDDLVLCIGVASASKLEIIRLDINGGIAAANKGSAAIEIEPLPCTYLIDYNADLNFDSGLRINSDIGNGSFSTVVKANLRTSSVDSSSLAMSTVVAVKLPRPNIPTISMTDDEWITSTSLLAGLNQSSFVCKVFGCGMFPKQFVVMEFIGGDSLFDSVMAEKIPSGNDPNFVLSTVYGIASGLNFLHSYTHKSSGLSTPIIHGNLSPFHIMLDTNMKPIIIDFGLRIRSHLNEVVGVSDDSIAASSSSVSTKQVPMSIDDLPVQNLVWLAPEQVKGSGSASTASDVYALALVIR